VSGSRKRRDGEVKRTVDYAGIRGFNYTQPNARNDRDFWQRYSHDIVERDMGYARRLRLNSARIFLPYPVYRADPQRFLVNVRDFDRTAWRYGVSTNPIVFFEARFFPPEEEFRRVPGAADVTPHARGCGEARRWERRRPREARPRQPFEEHPL